MNINKILKKEKAFKLSTKGFKGGSSAFKPRLVRVIGKKYVNKKHLVIMTIALIICTLTIGTNWLLFPLGLKFPVLEVRFKNE